MNNDTTQQDNTQDLSPDQTASSLAFVTHLSEQMMPKDMPQEDPQEAQTAPQQEQPQEPQNAPQEDIAAQIKSAVEEQVGGLREEVKRALAEPDDTKDETKDPKGDGLEEMKSMMKDLMKEVKNTSSEMATFKKELKNLVNE